MLRTLIRSVLLVASVAACGDYASPSSPLPGTWTATTFTVVPRGQAPLDVLAGGGSPTITIAANNTTSGTLTGSRVTFTQSADTFVRDLQWTLSGKSLSVTNAVAGTTLFTITLTRP